MSDTSRDDGLALDVQIEAALLKALATRANYDLYYRIVDKRRLLPNTKLILADYSKYYQLYETDENIEFDKFYNHFSQGWHSSDLDDNDIDYYRNHAFPIIASTKVEDVTRCLELLEQRKASEAIKKSIDSKFNIEHLETILSSYRQTTDALVSSIDSDALSIDKISFEELDKEHGIPFFLPSLQRGLGSLVKGQFVLVSADYGTGKSAFVISQAVATFKHLHNTEQLSPILYFNSEGTAADVYGRFLSNLYNTPFEEVVQSADSFREKFVSSYDKDNFLVFQMFTGDFPKIVTKMEKYNPSLIIIDIADVLTSEENVLQLKKLYDNLRVLSAKYCPILATTQSGDTSYKFFDKEEQTMKTGTRRWLNEKDLYGSRTGKGGAADTIITIGKDDDIANIRYVSTPKQKRGEPVNCTCELLNKYSLYKEL